MTPDREDSRSLAVAMAAVALASFVFYRSVVAVFFAQDDFPWLWAAQHLSIDQLIQQFASRYEGETYVFWRPLSQQVWFWLNLRFWGLSAEVFHLSNLVFHTFDSILAFLVARSLLKNTTWAAVTGILYGTNPVHFQAVAWPAAFTAGETNPD